MSGLDKIKARIREEAGQSASEIISQAQKEAREMVETARAQTQAEAEKMTAKASEEDRRYAERISSSLDMKRKQAVLAAKQDVIGEVLEKAYRTVLNLDEKQYFEMLGKMLEKYVLPADGEIFFSGKDLKRMPEGFAERIKSIAAARGGTLILSEKGADLDGGFILSYGGIEENCTIKAVFDSEKEELSDQVNRILFG